MNPSDFLHTERVALLTAMMRPSSLPELAVQPQHFASEQHAQIWEAIQSLSIDGKPVDPVSVGVRLEQDGYASLASLPIAIANASELVVSSQPAYYAQLLLEAWRSREARGIAATLSEGVKRKDPDAIDNAIASLMALHANDRDCEHTAKTAMHAAWKQVEEAARNGGALVGIPTGLNELDEKLGGLHDSDLIVVGARPAMGKTGLLLQMVMAAAKGQPVGLISGEQPHEQVGLRWMAAGSAVSVGRLRAAKIEEEQWSGLTSTVADLSERPVRIYDRSNPELVDVVRVARRWKQQHGIKALYVDYLQRIEVKSDAPKHERVGMVARGLKNLARDLQIPVVVLAQVSRAVEQRQNTRPQMGDLADSSEIEKEADQIMTLWRDLSNPQAEVSDAEINIVKNRHGNIGKVNCRWHGPTTSFQGASFDSSRAYGNRGPAYAD